LPVHTTPAFARALADRLAAGGASMVVERIALHQETGVSRGGYFDEALGEYIAPHPETMPVWEPIEDTRQPVTADEVSWTSTLPSPAVCRWRATDPAGHFDHTTDAVHLEPGDRLSTVLTVGRIAC